VGIIDSDVHNMVKSPQSLNPYLARRWHEHRVWPGVYRAHGGLMLGAPARPSVFRIDTFPEDGPPGSSLKLLQEQLLDAYRVSQAILHPILATLMFPQNGDHGAALAAATNDWMAAEWLSQDDRLYGGITVPVEDGNLAAAEIARVAGNRRFVKVVVPVTTLEPLGSSKYWPIYEAAAGAGLPVAAHVGGFSGAATGSGWSTYFSEYHTILVTAYSAQATSLLASGVLHRFPDLQFVFEEGGLAWLRPLMWRLDHAWRDAGDEVPHLDEPPSEIIRRHFWLSTQPLDEPWHHHHLGQLLDHLGMDDRILFASDYPHHDFDDAKRVLPAASVGRERRERIMTRNARGLYRFEDIP
jgi:predicted TIM-barrel fold metal-dependent hydrolase